MTERMRVLLAAVVITAAGLVAYHGIYHAPFVFDDAGSIEKNPTIRHLGAIGQVLSPPAADGRGVAGRPMVNLSLALNYASGGLAVEGYHALNVAIHLLASLALFGIARWALRAIGPAFTLALLWTVHPLLTESVSCIIQRTESLMGLFYLLTLYCFTRYSDETLTRSAPNNPPAATLARSITTSETLASERSGTRKRFVNFWALGSIASCFLGMATKEVMVSAPLIVFLYDRTFAAGSFAEAWRRRRSYYLGLAASWLVLVFLVARQGGSRSSAAGFGHGVSPWNYLLTQCWAIVHYLRLAVWPHPLIVDYGTAVLTHPLAVLPQALLIIALLAATVAALCARGDARKAGFLGAWFFAILGPSSSFIPLVTQTIAEHRMYLPLAALLAGFVWALGRWAAKAALPACLILAAVLTAATMARNRAYRSAVALWTDTIAHRPANLRARDSLGYALAAAGRPAEAVAVFQDTLRRDPGFGEAHYGLAGALRQSGRLAEAIPEYEQAALYAPAYPNARYSLGVALAESGRRDEAMAQYREALRLQPDYVEARNGLGIALAQAGRAGDALAEFQEALRIDPDSAAARVNSGNLYLGAGRPAEAITFYRDALRLHPENAEAHGYFGVALAHSGKLSEAMAEYREALRLKPDYAEAMINLGNALQTAGRLAEAVEQYRQAIRLRPDLAAAHENLGVALQALGRDGEAEEEYKKAARLEAGPLGSR